MGYTCWGTEHITVVAVSTLLWLAYAVGFPLSLAWVIRRDKAAAGERESADDVEASLPSSNGSEYWRSTRPMVEKFWFPVVAHLQPKYWWFFIVEFFRKVWINLLYLRGYRADDGFNWKLAVALYLLLESCSQLLLQPRVYKKSKDTVVDLCAKLFLVAVLMLAMWTESLEAGSNAEGEPVRATSKMLTPSLLLQLLAGLPGLAPLALNKLCTRLDRKDKSPAKQKASGPSGKTAVVRVHQDPPGRDRLRQAHRVRRIPRAACPIGQAQVHDGRQFASAFQVRPSTPLSDTETPADVEATPSKLRMPKLRMPKLQIPKLWSPSPSPLPPRSPAQISTSALPMPPRASTPPRGLRHFTSELTPTLPARASTSPRRATTTVLGYSGFEAPSLDALVRALLGLAASAHQRYMHCKCREPAMHHCTRLVG
jgi:hypothetical protein